MYPYINENQTSTLRSNEVNGLINKSLTAQAWVFIVAKRTENIPVTNKSWLLIMIFFYWQTIDNDIKANVQWVYEEAYIANSTILKMPSK